jgi:DUF218 domain
MRKTKEIDDSAYENLLQPIWAYLGVYDEPAPSDLIFVFGGLDLAVPRRAAELYNLGLAPQVLITGASGPLTKDVFDKSEAATFREEMVRHGVKESVILIEETATNTLANVLSGMALAAQHGLKVKTALLVAKTFLMRRCRATFQKQFPGVETLCCPPMGSLIDAIDRPRPEFASRLIAELKRLEDYSKKGDIVRQPLPEIVQEASAEVQALLS